MVHEQTVIDCPVRCVTPGEGQYFFGYYEKSPWDPTGRWMLAGRAEFADCQPGADDRLELGTIDPGKVEGDLTFTPVAETRAWNWQQGCMLQWLDERRIIFNDRRDDRFIAVILDVSTGERRELPRPIYTVSPQRGIATSLNFARLHRLRPGYGYAGVVDPTEAVAAPEDDGLYVMDLQTGEANLALTLAEAKQRLGSVGEGTGPHWFNHAQFNPAGDRLAMLHRWETGNAKQHWVTRMLTLNPDGSEVYPLIDAGMCSHYDWRDGAHLLAYARIREKDGTGRDGFFCFRDRTDATTPLAPERLTEDGHCSYSPDRRWVLNDTYPDATEGKRTLMLVRTADGAVFPIGRFYSPMPADRAIRCDLHPRWSRDGREVCIDSIHEGRRAMYVIDVTPITEGEPDAFLAEKEADERVERRDSSKGTRG